MSLWSQRFRPYSEGMIKSTSERTLALEPSLSSTEKENANLVVHEGNCKRVRGKKKLNSYEELKLGRYCALRTKRQAFRSAQSI